MNDLKIIINWSIRYGLQIESGNMIFDQTDINFNHPNPIEELKELCEDMIYRNNVEFMSIEVVSITIAGWKLPVDFNIKNIKPRIFISPQTYINILFGQYSEKLYQIALQDILPYIFFPNKVNLIKTSCTIRLDRLCDRVPIMKILHYKRLVSSLIDCNSQVFIIRRKVITECATYFKNKYQNIKDQRSLQIAICTKKPTIFIIGLMILLTNFK
jgi:hypothetical protein